MEILITILPIFLIIGLGYILRAKNIVKAPWVKNLNGFVYNVSLPALIIYSFSSLKWTETNIGQLLLIQLLIILITAIIVAIILRALPLSKKDQSVLFLTATVGNTVYLGIPLVTSALPGIVNADVTSIASAIGVVQLVGSMLIALFVIEYLFLGSRDNKFIGQSILRNPLVLAIMAGLLLGMLGWPVWLERSIGIPLKLLAGTASPLALFMLGSFLFGHKINRKQERLTLALLLKLGLAPLIAWLVMVGLQIFSTDRNITVLMTGMPVAVTAFVLSETYELDSTFAAATMLMTTVLSIITVPILASILGL
ncbi:MAG: AEC family transporter [bacterium]